MNEKEELIKVLKEELQWVMYRQKMLDMIQEKLLQMKQLVELANQDNIATKELEEINTNLNSLEAQVRALDSESRKMEDKKILE